MSKLPVPNFICPGIENSSQSAYSVVNVTYQQMSRLSSILGVSENLIQSPFHRSHDRYVTSIVSPMAALISGSIHRSTDMTDSNFALSLD